MINILKIKNYPQYQLYLFTKLLCENKEDLIPDSCDDRCINSTIINRSYYSAYSYSSLWLNNKYNFKVKKSWDFINDNEQYKSEHRQVIDELKYKKQFTCSNKLMECKRIRNIADYEMFHDITDKDVENCFKNMEYVIKKLKLEL